MKMEKVKNIVIGFGKGGKTLAKTLASKGEEVLVIERSAQMYGGTCINIGCLPSKRNTCYQLNLGSAISLVQPQY